RAVETREDSGAPRDLVKILADSIPAVDDPRARDAVSVVESHEELMTTARHEIAVREPQDPAAPCDDSDGGWQSIGHHDRVPIDVSDHRDSILPTEDDLIRAVAIEVDDREAIRPAKRPWIDARRERSELALARQLAKAPRAIDRSQLEEALARAKEGRRVTGQVPPVGRRERLASRARPSDRLVEPDDTRLAVSPIDERRRAVSRDDEPREIVP